jgi:hypothetical protein
VGSEPRDPKDKLLELDEPGVASVRGKDLADPPSVREPMATITDEFATEQARLKSVPSNTPPATLTEGDLDGLTAHEQAAWLRGRIAPLNRVPRLAKAMTELGALLEDPKTAFVLGFVDGVLPLDTIIDVTGLPETDTLRVLDHMIAQGIVVFRK